MKYFKNQDATEVFAFEADGSQDEFIPAELISITAEEADALRAQLQQARFDSLTYAQKRSFEYPPITDYIDGVVKGDQAQIDKYIADCLAVKEKYPKPASE